MKLQWEVPVLALGLFAAGYLLRAGYEELAVWRGERTIAPVGHTAQPLPTVAEDLVESAIVFDDVASKLGLDFTFYDGAQGNYYIFESTGGGMAVADFDNDGRADIYFVNACSMPPSVNRAQPSRMFVQHGSMFADVSTVAGVDLAAYGQGACAGDYDNDGFEDLFVSAFGRTTLFHNHGDGTFEDVAERAGVSSDRWTTSAAFADLDGDGDSDLYVCAYGTVSLEQPLVCQYQGIRVHCGPQQYQAQADLLFVNDGAGCFADRAQSAGISDTDGRGLGVAIADLTGDGLPDVFVANDRSANYLYVNHGKMRFEESALHLGVALNGAGQLMASMGVGCADFDQDGRLDLFVTDFFEVPNVLFRNLGPLGFIDEAGPAGLAASSRDKLGFGTAFLDADLDGRPDLFIANGHVSDMSALGIPYRMRPQMHRNLGNGKFAETSASAGPYFHRPLLGRGVATGDFDDDGRCDIAVSHILEPAALLLNRTSPHGHWVGLEFVGSLSHRTSRNVKVTVQTGSDRHVFESTAGGGYLSSSDPRIIVGVGPDPVPTTIDVEWPSGIRQRFEPKGIDRYHLVREPLSGQTE